MHLSNKCPLFDAMSNGSTFFESPGSIFVIIQNFYLLKEALEANGFKIPYKIVPTHGASPRH